MNEALRRRALGLAAFTIVYNLLEGAVSLGFGLHDDSMALAGFGADSLIEVASALIILWRLRGWEDVERERKAATGIGALFVLLGVVILAGSLLQLRAHAHPPTTWPGLIIAVLSLGIMAWLWRAKLALGRTLQSPALLADAACSRACLQLSGVLFTGSLLFLLSQRFWWMDGLAALVLALLITKEGVGMIREARKPDFAGGCGCH